MRNFDKHTKKLIDDVISNLASLAGVNANRLNKFISNISSENYEDEGDVVNDSYIGNVIKFDSEYIYVKSVNPAHNGLYRISGRSLRIEDYDGEFNLSISNGTTKYVQESVIANSTLDIISDEEFVKELMNFKGLDPVSLYEVFCEVQVTATLDELVEELPEETPVEEKIVEEETPVEEEVVEEETPVE